MSEHWPVDDSLGRIVVDIFALELGQEDVAVGHSTAEPAGGAGLDQSALHAVFAQGMGARPFGGLAVAAALNPRLKRRIPRERSENPGRADGIVAGGGHVPQP